MRTPRPIVVLIKRLLTIVIYVGAIAFLGIALHRSWIEFTQLALNNAVLTTIVLLSFGYAASFALLFASWTYTLRRILPERIGLNRASYVYFVANIAKYLPGNIFHLAGRQILGKKAGWNHGPIARATFLEISAIVAAGSVLLLLVAAIDLDQFSNAFVPHHTAALPITIRTIALGLLVAVVLLIIMCLRLRIFRRLLGVTVSTICVAILFCSLFFLCNAMMAVLLGRTLGVGAPDFPPVFVGTSYVAAWVAGFVVPGAPGGLGIRESVLVLFIAGGNEEMAAPALGLALGMRLASALGDIICAAGAIWLWRHSTQGADRGTNVAHDG